MKKVLLSIFICSTNFIFGQTATDIFVFNVEINSDTLIYSSYKNITAENIGYDNQPNFSKNGNSILFTSYRNTEQADIYKYDILSNSTKQITATKTSEYSPTLLKNNNFSTVVVEEDGTQRIWLVDQKTNETKVLMSKVKGVGYHSWLNKKQLALFVVGKPHELHLANINTNSSKKIAENIGSAIHKNGKNSFAFIDLTDSTNCKIKAYNIKTDVFNSICNCIENAEYFIPLKNGNLLSGIGKSLYLFNRKINKWKLIADFSAIENFNFYRLAINKKENKLALVIR